MTTTRTKPTTANSMATPRMPGTPNPNWAQLPLFDRSKWETVRFGDVVELVSDTSRNPEAEGITRYIGLEHLEPGSLDIKTWGELVDGVTFTKRCRKGQVLFGKRRAYQRKVAIAEFEALVSGDIYVFQAKEELLDPKLLPFLCMSERFFQFAVETSAGSLSPRTNWSHLKDFEFALPPQDQQRRIAELLWAVDEVIECTKQTASTCDPLIKALLGLPLTAYPLRRLDEVVDFLDGKRVPLSEKERAKRQGKYPYYGASGVIDRIDDFLFDEPLVLLSEDGFNLVNRTSRIAFKIEGRTWVNNHAHVLRPKDNINIDYLAEYIESLSLDEYITGTYQRKLNKGVCESIPIPLPPMEVQDEIATRILELHEVSDVSAKHIDNGQRLIQSFLGQYF